MERLIRMNNKVSLDFLTISQALKSFSIPEVDHVVGIATGGIIPTSLVAHQIDRPLSLMHINYREPDNSPRHAEPVLVYWQAVLATSVIRPQLRLKIQRRAHYCSLSLSWLWSLPLPLNSFPAGLLPAI
jgi:hypothetical protein